jgi:hypothetical protein
VLKKLIIPLLVVLVDLLWLNVETLEIGGSVVGIVALSTLMLVW